MSVNHMLDHLFNIFKQSCWEIQLAYVFSHRSCSMNIGFDHIDDDYVLTYVIAKSIYIHID